MSDLWHLADCVKPDKLDFDNACLTFLNNLYLSVFIKIFYEHPTTSLKYKLYKLVDFIKNFKHIRQMPLVINNHVFSRNL